MSRRPLLFLCLLAAAGLSSQCKKAPVATTAPAPDALAVVAGQAITEEDLLAEARWRQAKRQPVPAPAELLQEMVNRLALVERARKAGLADEPETKRRLESVLIARLREQQLDAELAKVEVSDEELAAAYQERLAEFSQAALDRFAILFQEVDAKASETRRAEARQRLESGLAQAAAAPAGGGRGPAASGFGATAIDYSDDQIGRHRGGDIGWVAEAADTPRVPAEVLAAGRALELGARSGVIETAQGFYAIMKTDSRPGGARPLEQVAGELKQTLLREKRRAMEERFLAEALGAAAATLDTAAASRVEIPDSPPTPASEAAPPSFPAAAR
jgi:parvulin-like peptidyl-prolyl isomerase